MLDIGQKKYKGLCFTWVLNYKTHWCQLEKKRKENDFLKNVYYAVKYELMSTDILVSHCHYETINLFHCSHRCDWDLVTHKNLNFTCKKLLKSNSIQTGIFALKTDYLWKYRKYVQCTSLHGQCQIYLSFYIDTCRMIWFI